jgi:hypothetical protein
MSASRAAACCGEYEDNNRDPHSDHIRVIGDSERGRASGVIAEHWPKSVPPPRDLLRRLEDVAARFSHEEHRGE